MPRRRRLRFTFYETDVQSFQQVDELLRTLDFITFAGWQLEECPSTGRKHFQGYLEFDRAMRFESIKEIFPTMNLRTCEASSKANVDYVSKEATRFDGPWKRGEPRKQGKGRFDAIRDMIFDGASDMDILCEYPGMYMRYYKAIDRIRSLMRPTLRDTPPEVIVYYGPTGTGKTRKVWQDYPDHYEVPRADLRWITPYYQGQKTMVIHEFEGQAEFDQFLKFTDAYPVELEVKGSFRWVYPERIIITTNKHPSEWYALREYIAPLKRRITKIYLFSLDEPPKLLEW